MRNRELLSDDECDAFIAWRKALLSGRLTGPTGEAGAYVAMVKVVRDIARRHVRPEEA